MCAQPAKQNITIKKYANRRLYNTATSSYVTLEDLSEMVKNGSEFNVYDAKTSEDITRTVLTQIIVEEESKEDQPNLLPINFLRQLIGFYGDNLQWMVPKYLEHSMDILSGNQQQIRDYFQTTLGNMFPFGSTLEEMSKQNMSMFENAMRMFSPMAGFDALTSTMPSYAPSSTTTTNATAPSTNSCCSVKIDTTTSTAKMTKAKPSDSCCTTAPTASSAIETKSCCTTKNDSNNTIETTTKVTPAPVQTASVTNLKPRTTSNDTTSAPSTVTTSTPMPNVQNVTANNSGAEDMQQKIANLQRQLADLAKSRA